MFAFFFSQDCLNISNVTKKSAAFGPLVYVWLLSMFKIRMGMLAMGMCLLFIRRENFKLTAAAKVRVGICNCVLFV